MRRGNAIIKTLHECGIAYLRAWLVCCHECSIACLAGVLHAVMNLVSCHEEKLHPRSSEGSKIAIAS